MTYTFYFENGTSHRISGRSWGKILGQALYQARTRGRILGHD